MSIYKQLGVRRVVNGRGRMTVLGGSVLPKEVIDAIIEANTYFVDMDELQTRVVNLLPSFSEQRAPV